MFVVRKGDKIITSFWWRIVFIILFFVTIFVGTLLTPFYRLFGYRGFWFKDHEGAFNFNTNGALHRWVEE